MASDFAHDLIALLPRLRRFARALAADADEADDLVQTACEKALRGRHGFVPGTRLDAWMFRILRNVFLDARRASASRGGAHAPLEAAEEIAGWDGRSLLETRLLLERAREAMTRLPVEQREVLALVCIEGLSYAEAAEVLQVPLGTVMSRLARGRARLSALLGLAAGEDVP